ncbi:MAG: universal stress protein [Deltaproteobacteria bacterium]|nr:universal stress protein [Deltaproteobacteria bacterium]
MKLKHIVVATDFSPISRRAVEAGLALAAKAGAKLTIAHILPSVVPIYAALPTQISKDLSAKQDAVKRTLHARLERLIEEAGKAGVRATALFETGDPVARILHLAAAKRADLIVVATHGRGAAAHLLLGSVAEKIVRQAPCSVLVVKKGKWRAKGRALIALDRSAVTPRVLKGAAQLAEQIGARLSVVHVINDTRQVADALASSHPGNILDAITKLGIERARKGIGETLSEAGVRVKPADILIREGRPQDVIERESAKGVMLTIVGTHSRKGASRLFLGSVAEAVVRSARSPVLVLKGLH